ncbi:MAG: 30S ribosomal protein S16, partial [Chloroflexi bacterium]|nr:30S ribosomal protein S16 [Chloroflexota bacterium]
MLRIRLRRTGKKKQASYRVVVADGNAPRDGDFVEILGHYNPRTEPNTIVLNEERVKHWLGVGAQPSETVHRILFKQGLTTVEPPKRQTAPSKVEVAAARAEAEAVAAKAAEEAAKAAEAAAKAAADAEAAAAAAAAAAAP